MDVFEARRLVLLRLIDRRFEGNQAKFAAASGLSESYITRMLKPEGHANKKRIGEELAAKLEDKDLGLAPGSLVRPELNERGAAPSAAPLVERRSGGRRDSDRLGDDDSSADRRPPTDSEWTELEVLRALAQPVKEKMLREALEETAASTTRANEVLASYGATTVVPDEKVRRTIKPAPVFKRKKAAEK